MADGSAALSELSLMSGDMVTVEETAAEESPPNQDLQKAEASKQLGPDVCASCLDGEQSNPSDMIYILIFSFSQASSSSE